jgi:DNA cross-link repair 1C protein
MRNLFGHLCSGEDFAHDRIMRETVDQDQDSPASRKRQRDTPESDSRRETDDAENEGWQTTSHSFVSTTADSSDSLKGKRQGCSSEIVGPSTSAAVANIQVLNSQQEQYSSQKGTKRAHETISTSPLSSFSPSHTGKLNAIKHALKNVSGKLDIESQRIPHSIEESPPPQPQQEDDEATDGESERAGTPTPTHNHHIDTIDLDGDTDHDRGRDQPGNDIETETGESQSTLISYSAFESQPDSQSIPEDPNTRLWNIRGRVETYRRTRRGDWFDYAPTTSGNNHTEEEIEL